MVARLLNHNHKTFRKTLAYIHLNARTHARTQVRTYKRTHAGTRAHTHNVYL